MRAPWLFLLILVGGLACGGKKASPRAGHDAAAPSPTPPVDEPDAAVAANPQTPEALWAAYQAAHVGATRAASEPTGRAIDALLSEQARALIVESATQTVAAMPAGVNLSVEEVRYRLLGEAAATRVELIGRATLGPVQLTGDTATLTAHEGATALNFALIREDGGWRFGPSPSLLPDEDALFALPAGAAATTGAPSVEVAAAQWIAALNGGTGWDAFNQLAPSNRARLRLMVAQVGGSGDDDVVRILHKTLSDRRGRGITATRAPTIAAGTGDQRTVAFHYSDGGTDEMQAVREDGAWWIVLPF